MTGSAKLDSNGCWFVSGNGESALLIAPLGTRLGDDATTLATVDGTVIEDGLRIDATCGFVALEDLPGGADGRWAPRIDVTTPMPSAADPVSLSDDRFHASVTAGAHLFSHHCDDVAEWFEPEHTLAADWNITSGRFDYPGASSECRSGGPPAPVYQRPAQRLVRLRRFCSAASLDRPVVLADQSAR